MKQRWEEEDLISHWTLTGADKKFFFQRTDRGRFGLAVLLKFFQIEGRFPRYHKEVPTAALEYLGKQLAIPATLWFDYELKGRSGKRDREQIRDYLGFRPISAVDSEQLQGWLEREVVPEDQGLNYLRFSVLEWCREHRIEPPTNERIDRVVGSAVRTFENKFFEGIKSKLSAETLSRFDEVLSTMIQEEQAVEGESDYQPSIGVQRSEIRSGAGQLGKRRERDCQAIKHPGTPITKRSFHRYLPKDAETLPAAHRDGISLAIAPSS